MPFMCFLIFFILIGTYKFWAFFGHFYLLPLPTLFRNTVNLKALGFWGLTKKCLWSNSSVDAQSMTHIYVAARSQLVDAVFLLKFLWSFYEPLPATTHTCLVTCLIVALLCIFAILCRSWGRVRWRWWVRQLILLPLHFGNFGRIYQRPRRKRRKRAKKPAF